MGLEEVSVQMIGYVVRVPLLPHKDTHTHTPRTHNVRSDGLVTIPHRSLALSPPAHRNIMSSWRQASHTHKHSEYHYLILLTHTFDIGKYELNAFKCPVAEATLREDTHTSTMCSPNISIQIVASGIFILWQR